MAFDDLKVKLSRLKAFEGETLKRHSADTLLGLSKTDPEMSSEAIKEVKLDIIDETSKYFYDSTYDSFNDLLDDLADADSDNMIERLMAVKFLELFFGDQSLNGDAAEEKALFYERKYASEKSKVSNMLLANMSKPKIPNRARFTR